MFIRKVQHTHAKTGAKYYTYKLVESVRTDRGPRQNVVLNLGVDLSIPQEEWKALADRIEGIITKQIPLFPVPKHIESPARIYAREIIRRHARELEAEKAASSETKNPSASETGNSSTSETDKPTLSEEDKPASFEADKPALPEKGKSIHLKQVPDYQTVDISTLENEGIRTVGGEHVVLEMIRELKLDHLFYELGFNKSNVDTAIGVIAARLLEPASERATHIWLQNRTALDDLLLTTFATLSQDRVYRISDQLLKHKGKIEAHLESQEKTLFNLKENILLYDMTNTFIEGSGKYNPKAHFGVSKEKRSDCPLVTLGLVLDSDGFPKKSEIFAGNVSEPGTLEEMIRSLYCGIGRPMIVMDAGFATEKNIQWLKTKEFDYLVVSRKRKKEIPSDLELVTVRQNVQRIVRACKIQEEGKDEVEVYCHSTAKEIKEKGIKTRFEKRFEDELIKIQNGLSQKYGTKKYEKVVERIGRLKERFRRVSRRYDISVEKDDETGYGKNFTWRMKEEDTTNGYYILRTNRKNLEEKELFDIFTQLLDIESAFRSMKSELGLRPIHHQIERRTDGHLFITVIAYHILHSIRYKLKERGITDSWETIRKVLSTQYRVTTSVKRSDGKILYIRKTSRPEPDHIKVYEALSVSTFPGKTTKTIL